MRFLGLGDTCDLAALYRRLAMQGHEVRVEVTEPICADILAGVVTHVADWRGELDWLRATSDSGGDDGGGGGGGGIVLVENVAHDRGRLQDELRRDGFHVVGGCEWGDRLENDRGFAQAVLAELGFATLRSWQFDGFAGARAFVAAHPARYVSKLNGPGLGAAGTYVGRMRDGRDVHAVLGAHERLLAGAPTEVVLMEHVDGIEIGVGAYFNGHDFLRPACLDWEHKRFFPGDLGEMVGEMGTVATFDRSDALFDRTLARLAPSLRANGYVGYINLNTIVNDAGVWPLEFTCRFGYPGFAVLEPLQALPWADLFATMVTRSSVDLPVRPGFALGVVLTTRPFPFIRHHVPEPTGLPILFDPELDPHQQEHLHFGEVGWPDGAPATAGYHGWTGVATGTGATVAEAQAAAYALAGRVVVPNLRYRNDIGDRLIAGDLDRLEELGVLS